MTRRLITTLWPIALLWLCVALLAVLTDAHWPPRGWRFDFLLVAGIATFDLLMASLLLRRMKTFDLLALALAHVFLVKGALWFYATTAQLWPGFADAHADSIRWALRIGLAVSLGFAFIMLLITPDDEYAQHESSEQHDRESAREMADTKARL